MRKRRTPDQVTKLLGEIQADLDAGLTLELALRKAGVSVSTYHRWRAKQESTVSSEQFHIRELELEVDRLKLLVAELALDRRMLQDALKKKP